MNQAWKTEIEKEYASLSADDAVLLNSEMHQHILASWEQHSPKMWVNLQAAGPGFADKLAYVMQERAFQREKELMRGGMPYTDACEMAERENLMLEPEEDLPPDRYDAWTPPVPDHVLKAPSRPHDRISLQAVADEPTATDRRVQRELELLEAVAAVPPEISRRIQNDTIGMFLGAIVLMLAIKLVFG